MNIPRGIRNNNPGNIKKLGSSPWKGMALEQLDPIFVTFVTMAYGVRAMGKLIQNYQKIYKLNTISSIIKRWTDSAVDDQVAYINTVEKSSGFYKNELLNMKDLTQLSKIIKGMITQENGSKWVPSDEVIMEGLNLI